MNVYHYIAENNPDAANEVCKKYGFYQINSIDELADCLQHIVAQDGEESFKDVMELHPDKDVILELFDKKKEETLIHQPQPQPIVLGADGSSNCSCVKSSADGTTTPTSTVSNTNLMILAGALIISISIISLIKSKS